MQSIKYIFLLAIFTTCCLAGSLSEKEIQDTVVGVDIGNNKLRAFSVTAQPDFSTPYAITLAGLDATRFPNGDVAGDAAIFRFVTPQFNPFSDNQLSVYFGYWAAAISHNVNENTINQVSASLQLLVRFYDIIIWKNQDGVEGLQFSLDGDLLCSSGVTTTDCLIEAYDLSKATWKPIAYNTYNNTYNNQVYTVYVFTAETQDGVFALNYTVASRPVQVNGVTINSDQTKMDVVIRYFDNPNYTNVTSDPDALVGLTAIGAASVGASAISLSANGASASKLEFGNGTYKGYFSWEGNCEVNTSSGINTQSVGFKQITAADLAAMNQLNPYVIYWQVVYNLYAGFGWALRLYYFSYSGTRPSQIVWDPEIGGDLNYATDAPASPTTGGAGLLSTNVLLIITCFFILFYHLRRK